MQKNNRSKMRWIYLIVLVISSSLLALIAVWLPVMQDAMLSAPQVGQVVDRDYRAPETVSFESQILTQSRRENAERSVQPIYTSPDTRIARQQLERLRTSLSYISTVRADSHATNKQKLEDLAAMDDIHLSQESANLIISLTDTRWQAIQQEAILALEKVMSSAIRPEGIDDARNRVPALEIGRAHV